MVYSRTNGIWMQCTALEPHLRRLFLSRQSRPRRRATAHFVWICLGIFHSDPFLSAAIRARARGVKNFSRSGTTATKSLKPRSRTSCVFPVNGPTVAVTHVLNVTRTRTKSWALVDFIQCGTARFSPVPGDPKSAPCGLLSVWIEDRSKIFVFTNVYFRKVDVCTEWILKIHRRRASNREFWLAVQHPISSYRYETCPVRPNWIVECVCIG